MMTGITDIALAAKIAKLVPLLGSNHDGEVVAAARSIVRVLDAKGLTLHDLAGNIEVGTLSVPAYSPPPSWSDEFRRTKAPKSKPAPKPAMPVGDVTAAEIKSFGPALFAKRRFDGSDRSLVDQLWLLAHRKRFKFELSEQQASRWREILVKHKLVRRAAT